MQLYIYWFLLALVLLGLEMLTGTFYLLVVAIAMAAGGAAAWLGAGLEFQLILVAATGIAGIIILQRWKHDRQAKEASASSLDIGLPVKVLKWNDDGSARVAYRGAEWDAAPESADTPHEGTLYIKAVQGSSLVLTHRKQR